MPPSIPNAVEATRVEQNGINITSKKNYLVYFKYVTTRYVSVDLNKNKFYFSWYISYKNGLSISKMDKK